MRTLYGVHIDPVLTTPFDTQMYHITCTRMYQLQQFNQSDHKSLFVARHPRGAQKHTLLDAYTRTREMHDFLKTPKTLKIGQNDLKTLKNTIFDPFRSKIDPRPQNDP